MTSHKFYKRGLVTAEQFDEGWWQSKYHACKHVEEWEAVARPLSIDRYHGQFVIVTLEGDLRLNDGDWIATGVNGEHLPIADDIFRKTYASLPVIPRAVGMVIRKHREAGRDLAYALYEAMRVHSRRGRTDGKSAFSWIAENQDTFALAWLLGEWEVENG